MTGSLVAAISVGIIMLFVLLRAGANGNIFPDEVAKASPTPR